MTKIDKNDDKYIYYIVGKNIRRLRKKHKLTQIQLADLVGYNEGTISNIENDSFQTFSLEFVYVVSKKLNEPLEEFIKDLDERDKTYEKRENKIKSNTNIMHCIIISYSFLYSKKKVLIIKLSLKIHQYNFLLL